MTSCYSPVGYLYICSYIAYNGRDSSVCIAIRNRLKGSEINSQLRRDFPCPSRPALVPTQPPIQWLWCLSRG